MVYLILSIIASVGVFVIFKLAEIKNINIFSIIFINYIVATTLGFTLNNIDFNLNYIINSPWLFIAIIIGIMFTGMFFLIAYSTRKVGIAVTSVSVKLSLVIPISFSIFYDPADNLNLMKLAGISLAVFSIILLVWKKRTEKIDIKFMFLPIILFIGLGLVDSFVKFAQHDYLDESNVSLFSTLLFFFAWFTSLIAGFAIKYDFKQILNIKSTMVGSLLGIFNFGTVYFLILTLDTGRLPGSSVFGINNMGIILVSVIIALAFFKEKLNLMNKIGILISLIAIWILV